MSGKGCGLGRHRKPGEYDHQESRENHPGKVVPGRVHSAKAARHANCFARGCDCAESVERSRSCRRLSPARSGWIVRKLGESTTQLQKGEDFTTCSGTLPPPSRSPVRSRPRRSPTPLSPAFNGLLTSWARDTRLEKFRKKRTSEEENCAPLQEVMP
jgi:hypothetical protein